MQIQLTLEQHGFELCESIYMWILKNKYPVTPLYLQVLHPQIQPTANVTGQPYKLFYTCGFWCWGEGDGTKPPADTEGEL